MKKIFAVALCAFVGCGLYAAEEVFDLVYKADSMEMPTAVGFQSSGYQSKNANGAQYASLAPNDEGDTVLLLNHQDKKGEWPIFKKVWDKDFKTVTVDITYRLADTETQDPQVCFYAALKDTKRPKNRFGFVNIAASKIVMANGNIEFASGNTVQSLRFIVDADANAIEAYDLKTNKFLGKKWMANAGEKTVVNTIAFGDGSSGIHGIAEIFEIKFAFDKKYIPAAK